MTSSCSLDEVKPCVPVFILSKSPGDYGQLTCRQRKCYGGHQIGTLPQSPTLSEWLGRRNLDLSYRYLMFDTSGLS